MKDPSKESLPRPRQRIFYLALAALILLGVEAGAWVMLRLLPTPDRGTAEAAGRAVDAAEDDPTAAFGELLRSEEALHPYLGYVLDPNGNPKANDPRRNPEATDYGFPWSRENLFWTPDEDRLVIAVLGGSVAAIMVNNGTRILRQVLAESARFAGREVVVTNLGQPGYKQPQQLATLAYLLTLGAHFDLVVNLDGFNDVALAAAENVSKGVAPFYPRQWYFRVAELDPTLRAAAGELTYLEALREEREVALRDSPWRHSATVRLLWEVADRRLATRIARRQLELLAAGPEASTSYQARGPRRSTAAPEELYRELAELWRRSSLQMHHLCRGLGTEYYHFLQPNQYDAGSKPLTPEELRDSYDGSHPYRAGVVAGYPLLKRSGAELRRAGVAFHDLSRAFARVDETLYADTCCHFNRRGNHILARRIAEIIARSEARLDSDRG